MKSLNGFRAALAALVLVPSVGFAAPQLTPCDPTSDGLACNDQVACLTAGNRCVATCMSFNPNTGESYVTDCECQDPGQCQVTGQSSSGALCVAPNIAGTANFVPACDYKGPMNITVGLPPGTTIEIDATFGIPFAPITVPGGPLGGEVTVYNQALNMVITGTGVLAAFNRNINVPMMTTVYSAPRFPGMPVQNFAALIQSSTGQIIGDPDFCTIDVTIGDFHGLPSPGQTTFTRLGGPGANFNVHSFFDITYEIDFVGCPGSALQGFGGVTQDVTRIEAGGPVGVMPSCTGSCPPGMVCDQTVTLNSNGFVEVCCGCIPDATLGFPTACNGDGGNQNGCTDCPCNNNAPIGTIGGCRNSANTSARLIGTGDASVSLPFGSNADLRFSLTGAPPLAFCILNAGDAIAPQNIVNPCFGLDSGVQALVFDGLRCAIQNTRRHGGRSADANGDVGVTNSPWGGAGGPGVGIAVAGGYGAGQTRHFQAINRDDPLTVCMRGLNTSQAVTVVFTP